MYDKTFNLALLAIVPKFFMLQKQLKFNAAKNILNKDAEHCYKKIVITMILANYYNVTKWAKFYDFF